VLEIPCTHVVGVSMGGGMIARSWRCGTRAGGSLVLACTYPEPDTDIERQRTFSVSQLGGQVTGSGAIEIDVRSLDPMAFFQQFLPLAFSEEFIQTTLRADGGVCRCAAVRVQPRGDPGAGGGGMGHKATDRLHQIAVPTLVITGDADRLGAAGELGHPGPSTSRGRQVVKIPGGTTRSTSRTPTFSTRGAALLASVDA